MKTRWQTLTLCSILSVLCLLLSCTTDPTGTSGTELKFQHIADSLSLAGYDKLEISITKLDGSDSSGLLRTSLTPGGKVAGVTVPEGLGKSYRVIVKATKTGDPGLVFSKTYTVSEGAITGSLIVVIPGSGSSTPTGVVIDAEFLTLAAGGDSAPLAARVLPYPKANQAIAWSSSNLAVATVSADGMVRSGVAGTAVITAGSVADPSKTATLEVTVAAVQTVDSLVLDPHTLRYFLGMPKSALTVKMFPASAAALVEWSSSNPAVATVSVDGRVTGVTVGQAVIRAQYKGDAAKADSCQVTVVLDPPILNVGADVSVAVGATVAFPITDAQEFGGIVEFKWTLTGDTNAYSTAASLPTGLSHTYTAAGRFTAMFIARDLEGNVVRAQRVVHVGGSAPLVVITSPADGAYTNKTSIAVAWSVNGVAQTTLLTDSLKVEGENTITREFTNTAGTKGSASVKVIRDTKEPEVVITSPAGGTVTSKAVIAVAWSVDGEAQTALLTDSLKEGSNSISRSFTDSAGNQGTASVTVTRDSQAPSVAITAPAAGFVTNKSTVTVAWSVDGVAQTTQLSDSLKTEGENTITREFTNTAGTKGSASVKVIRDTKAPVVAITSPAANAKVTVNPVAVIWTVDGVSQSALTSETLSAGDGAKTITRTAVDSAGNAATPVSVTVTLDKDQPVAPVLVAAGTTVSPSRADSATWKWTSGNSAFGNGVYQYWLDAAAVPASPASITGTSLTLAVAAGTRTLYLREGDNQGNWSPVSNFTPILVDRTAPTIAIDQAAQTVSNPAFTLSAAVNDANAIASVDVAGAFGGNGAMTLATGKYTRAVTLAAGANTLTITAKDQAGNSRTASVVITFTKPTITITYPPAGFVSSVGAFTVRYNYLNPAVSSTPVAKTEAQVLADGKNTITITDNAGLADPKSIDVYILSTVVFVRKGAPNGGGGTSWDSAYNDLYAALQSTRGGTAGNKIWISAATYNNGNVDNVGYYGPAPGVSLYGGFPASGRPFTEAGRDLSASGPKTIIGNNPDVPWGGLMTASGPATIDGLVFRQTTGGPNAIFVGNGNGGTRTNITFKSCEFRSTAADGPISWLYSNTANVNFDSCTFTGMYTTGSLFGVMNSNLKFTRSFITGNKCQAIATVDGDMHFTSTTVNGNSAVVSGDPAPDIEVQTGSLFRHAGVVTNVPALVATPVTP